MLAGYRELLRSSTSGASTERTALSADGQQISQLIAQTIIEDSSEPTLQMGIAHTLVFATQGFEESLAATLIDADSIENVTSNAEFLTPHRAALSAQREESSMKRKCCGVSGEVEPLSSTSVIRQPDAKSGDEIPKSQIVSPMLLAMKKAEMPKPVEAKKSISAFPNLEPLDPPKNHRWQLLWEDLQVLGWRVEQVPKGNAGATQPYYLPPGVLRGPGSKNRVDYFDSKVLVQNYVNRGDALSGPICAPLKGWMVALSGFAAQEECEIRKIAIQCGASFVQDVPAKRSPIGNLALIAKGKFETLNFALALAYSVCPVTREWLEETARTGVVASVETYSLALANTSLSRLELAHAFVPHRRFVFCHLTSAIVPIGVHLRGSSEFVSMWGDVLLVAGARVFPELCQECRYVLTQQVPLRARRSESAEFSSNIRVVNLAWLKKCLELQREVPLTTRRRLSFKQPTAAKGSYEVSVIFY